MKYTLNKYGYLGFFLLLNVSLQAQNNIILDTVKYILTPQPSPQPKINGAKVFGVRPNSPIIYTIAATGNRPMTFSASKLPKGVKLDKNTGRLSGKIAQKGIYKMTLRAKNALGTTKRELRLVVGDAISLTPLMRKVRCFHIKSFEQQ